MLVARQFRLAETAPAFEGLLAKVERVLPEATRERIQAVEQTVIFESSTFRSAPSSLAVTVLSSAVQSAHSVRLNYRSARAHGTERVFDPYGVVYHEDLCYTIGYCHLRQGQRLFRLDRILQVAILSETFSPPADFQALTAARFLAGLGVPLVIHHPPELRAVVRQYALALANQAECTARDGK